MLVALDREYWVSCHFLKSRLWNLRCNILYVFLERTFINLTMHTVGQVMVKVLTVFRDSGEVNSARPGENLKVRLSGVEEENILTGFVLSSVGKYLNVSLLNIKNFHSWFTGVSDFSSGIPDICECHVMFFKRISSYPVLTPQAIFPDYLLSPNSRKSSADKPVPVVSEFDAQLQILELIDHKVLLTIATSSMRRICEVT